MVFSSSIFLFAFLPIVLFVYYVLCRSRGGRNLFLFLASLAFYAYGEPWFVFVMIGSIFGNWLFGLAVDRFREERNVARRFVTLALLFNLGILFIFKYLMFVLGNLNIVLGARLPVPEITLPIGISFFTFQAISYVIDVYRKDVPARDDGGRACRNPLDVGLYIALFPQLIAGPIVRYSTIADQIHGRKESFDDFSEGVNRFIFGMAKKVLIANNLALVADFAYSTDSLTVATAWLGALAYTLQIYFDFSGYSDMAIGLGRMFGFRFQENFRYPYVSSSITEFWRRWHISLGTWFRDYVYFPLGGSRVSSRARLVLNLFVVWSLTGLWHGANWTFIVWGLIYFVLLTIEKLTGFAKRPHPLGHIYAMFFVILGWTIFRAVDLSQAWVMIRTMFGASHVPLWDDQTIFWLMEHRYFFLFGMIFSLPVVPWVRDRLQKPRLVTSILYVTMMAFLLLTSIAYVVKGAYNPFIYYNF